MDMTCDVAVIGGGPAGSTVGSFLKKYSPDLNVLILERDRFPRDHVGESQLPGLCQVLAEMGVWEKVEAANFPIKIGATYRWGRTKDLWDFEFFPADKFVDEPRPAKYAGQRVETAFQVDRAVYDEILLDHARELGCQVREETRVLRVETDGDRVKGLVLESGETVKAKYYVDCSGGSGILRRAMNVAVDYPTNLRNIAIWDYWQNADWAIEIGVGATRVQIMSLGYGWIWFIPLGPTRTSVGLVTPADYYKSCGMKPAELYAKALAEEPRISDLMRNAVSEGKLQTTNDWSFLASRAAGENWFLAGDSAGFADPILSAGMTLGQTAAREVAYTILELERGEHEPEWLKSRFEEAYRSRIQSHIQFADFWYSTNAVFTDLKDYTSIIAERAGLKLSADEAFRWLSTGGFAYDTYTVPQLGTWSIGAVKQMAQVFTGTEAAWQVGRNNIFKLNLDGAEWEHVPILAEGRIRKVRSYRRNGKLLPNNGEFRAVIHALRRQSIIFPIVAELDGYYRQQGRNPLEHVPYAIQALEAMIAEGWVEASYDPNIPLFILETADETENMHLNRDPAAAV